MDKAFVQSETNTHFFFDLLRQESGFAEASLDGAASEAMKGGPAGTSAQANDQKDGILQGSEVIAAAFNQLTRLYPKITEHFQKLGLDLAAMLEPDGQIKASFIAAARKRLLNEDPNSKTSSLDFMAAQFLIAEQNGVSNKDPVFLEKWDAFSRLPVADQQTQIKAYLAKPENSAKLVRWAFRLSELSLLPFKDQVDILKEWGVGEATAKSALAPLWQNRGLPKMVAQAALLQGLALEEEAKTVDENSSAEKRGQARLLYRAAAELDRENPLARRRLAVHLVREGKLSSAGFHIGVAIQNETELRYIMENVAGIEKQDARLYAPAPDAYSFAAEKLIEAKRYGDAAQVYAEAAKAAQARGDQSANTAFIEKKLAAEESAKPFDILFTDKNNPVTARLYQAMREQGIPSALMEGALSSDHKISSKEVLAYLDQHWKEPRVQKALKSLSFPTLPWEVPGAKLPYDGEEFRKLDFAGKMVAWHLYDVAELSKKEPINLDEVARHQTLVTFYDPENSLRFIELGETQLKTKAYSEAAQTFETAFSLGGNQDFALKKKSGMAHFGAGDFEKSRAAYTACLEKSPKDPSLLELRHEVSKTLLAGLDEAKDPEKYKELSASIGSDYAMFLTVKPEGEKAKLQEIEKALEGLHDNKGEQAKTVAMLAGLKNADQVGGITKRDVLASLEGLAENYFQLAEQSYSDPKDVEAVRAAMNGFAGETFGILARFAKADSDPEIRKMTEVYEAYQLIADGKLDEAVAKLENVKKIPEAARVLAKIEKGRLRLYNDAALQVWEVYNQDLEATEIDEAKGWISGRGTSPAQVTKKYEAEKALTAAVRKKIETGEADTLKEALALVSEDGEESLKERAKFYLSPAAMGQDASAIGDIIDLVSAHPPMMERAQRVLKKAWALESKGRGLQAALGLYGLVHGVAQEDFLKDRAQQGLDALQGNASFGRSFEKFLSMSNSGNLAVDIGFLFVAAGLGNLAKLRMLAKLEKAGVSGYKAVMIAGGVGLTAEVTALWGLNTVKESGFTDPSKVFSASHLAKSYGATLIMIGGLKGFGKIGQNLGPQAAKKLNLVAEGGIQLSKGGKGLVWGFGHGFGMVGMVATSHVNQGLGLTPKPVGGWKEGLVHDVLGYAQFALAHGMANRVVGGKMQEVSMRQHGEIAYRESVLLAKGHSDAMGFKAETLKVTVAEEGKLSVDGKPLEEFDAPTKALIEAQLAKDKAGKIQDQNISLDGSSRRLIITLLTDAGLNRPGFSGLSLRKLIQAKQFHEANTYLEKYAVPLRFGKSGEVIAMGSQPGSPHALLGILSQGGKAKPITDDQIRDLTPEPSKPKSKSKRPPPVPLRKAKKKDSPTTKDSPLLAARRALPPPSSETPNPATGVLALPPVSSLPVPNAKIRPLPPPPTPTRRPLPTAKPLSLPPVPHLVTEKAWAEHFAIRRETQFAGKVTMFQDSLQALVERVKTDPRFKDPKFREVVEKRFNTTLEVLQPILDKMQGESRTNLAHALFKHVMQGQLGIHDARELAAGVSAGHYRLESSPGLGYRYIVLFHGVEVQPGTSLLVGKAGKNLRAIPGDGLVHASLGEKGSVHGDFKSKDGKTSAVFEARAGEAAIEVFDASTQTFRRLKDGEKAEIQDGELVMLGGDPYVFRSAESLKPEIQRRAELLTERDELFHLRGETSLLERGSANWKTKSLEIVKRQRVFDQLLREGFRNGNGSSTIEGELLALAAGSTPFAPAARRALNGEISSEKYREAQTEIGKELVESHRGAMEEVEQYLNGLFVDGLIEHRLSNDVRDETGKNLDNPHVRLKDPADVAAKLARRGWVALEPMTDYAGARLVVKNTNDALVIAADIEKNLKVRDAFNGRGEQEMDILGQEYQGGKETMNVTIRLDKDHPDRLLVGSDSGYRALHIVVEVEGKPVEIQIQTEAIFKWGKIQHSLIYKDKSLPAEAFEKLNEYCRDVAHYLTDLEDGHSPSGRQRPAQPALTLELPEKLKQGIERDISRMEALMDHYAKVAQDESQLKTKIFRPSDLQKEPGTPHEIPAEEDVTRRYRSSPPPLPPSRKKNTSAPVAGSDKDGIPERRGAAGGAKQVDLTGWSDSKSALPLLPKPSELRFRDGSLLTLNTQAKVAILGSKAGAELRLKGEEVAAEHAEISRDAQGRSWLRALHGNSVQVFKDGRWMDLVSDGKAGGHELFTGDRVRLGGMEFTWKASPRLEVTGVQQPTKVEPPSPPSLVARGSKLVQDFQSHADLAKGLGIKLTDLLEISDAGLAGRDEAWVPSFLNVSIPDTGHIPVSGGWRHLKQAEFVEARKNGQLHNTPPLYYTLHVEGPQRKADLEARLRKEYGPLLTSSDKGWMIHDPLGQAQVKIEFHLKQPTILQPVEARALYADFARESLPTIETWLRQEGSLESGYAFRVLQMIGVAPDGKGGSRFGVVFEEAVRRYETETDLVQKAREGETLATLCAYLLDAPVKLSEFQVLARAKEVRDNRGLMTALFEARKQGGELAKEAESIQKTMMELGHLSDDLRQKGDDLRARVRPEDRRSGNATYDSYYQIRNGLHEAMAKVQAFSKKLEDAGLKRKGPPPLPKPDKKDLKGASDLPSVDLLAFDTSTLENLRSLGVPRVERLKDPAGHEYANALVEGMDVLLKQAPQHPSHEMLVIRLINGLREWERSTGRHLEWLADYLQGFRRDRFGVPMDTPSVITAPPERLSLSTEDQARLGVAEINAQNVLDVVTSIRENSAPLDKIGGFSGFRLEPANSDLLWRVLQNYGPYIQHFRPELGAYLHALFEARPVYASNLEIDPKSSRRGSGGIPERRGEATAMKLGVDGDPLGFHYVEEISLNGSLGRELYSMAHPKPSLTKLIPGLSRELEMKFERGARIEKWSNGHTMLVDPPSGAHTVVVRPAQAAEIVAYVHWKNKRGFAPIPPVKAEQAWKALETRAQELGLSLYEGSNSTEGPLRGTALADFVRQNGAQIAQVRELMDLLPASYFTSGRIKRIFFKAPRQEDAHFSAYDAANGSLYLYSGAFTGSRRNLAALFLHETGHANAARYRLNAEGDSQIPMGVRQDIARAHRILVSQDALFVLDWAGGKAERKRMQQKDMEEFLADFQLAYVSAGPELRAHIRSLPEASMERKAWDYLYAEMSDRVFGGLEYDYRQRSAPPPTPLSERKTLKLVQPPKSSPSPGPIPARVEVPADYLSTSMGPAHAIETVNWGGVAASRHPGIGYKPHNEDRYSIGAFTLPDGSRVVRSFVVDGMGGHGKGEFAGAFVRYVVEKASSHPEMSLEAALRMADRQLVEHPEHRDAVAEGGQSRAPGAVAVGMEVKDKGQGDYEVKFAHVGDSEAFLLNSNFEVDPQAYTTREFLTNRQLPRGMTLFMRVNPLRNNVDQALGGHLQESQSELRVDTASHRGKKGDIAIAGSDGLFENFIGKGEMADLLRVSGAKTANQMQTVLMNEALIRMAIVERFEKDERFGQAITHEDFTRAYQGVWGFAPPAGAWRYEGMVLKKGGLIVDPRVDPTHDAAKGIRGSFKRDNVTVLVQVLGEKVTSKTTAEAAFRPAVLPPTARLELPEPSPILQRLMDMGSR